MYIFKNNSLNKKVIFLYWFILLFFIVIHSYSSKITTDYAWFINIIDWYIDDTNNIFYNSANGSYGGWGTIFIFLNAQIVKLWGTFYLNYWLLYLVYSLFGIFILYRLLKLMNNNTLDTYITILTYVLLTYATSLYIGTRPESIYGTSLVILLYLLFKFYQSNHYKWIYLASLVSTFGAMSHPNGLILYVVLLIFAIKLLIVKRLNYTHLIINILIIGFLFGYGILFGQTLDSFIASFTAISSDALHSIPFYHEYKRYDYFMSFYPLVKPIFLFTIFTLIIYIVKYIISKKDYFYENFISISAIVIFIYLTFLGAKWVYYLSLLFPFMVISLHTFLKNTLTCVICKKIIILSGIILLFVIAERDFQNNEEFTKFLFPNKQEIITIDNIKRDLRNKQIYAPMRLYTMFHQNKLFIPLKNKQPNTNNIQFVILLSFHGKEYYKEFEKKLSMTLIYQSDFEYNTLSYNIYKRSK